MIFQFAEKNPVRFPLYRNYNNCTVRFPE